MDDASAPAPLTPRETDAPAWARWLPWGLVVLVVLAYANTLGNPFVFDSKRYVFNEPALQSLSSLSDLRAVLTFDTRPLVALTVAVNYAIGHHPGSGTVDPLGFRLFNLLVHALAGLTLFGVVRRTLNLPGIKPRFGRASAGYAFVVAGLWLVHPLCTQGVSYMIQRGESMASLAILFTLYAAIRHWNANTKRRKRVWLWAATLSCLAGVFCKQIVIAAPLIVFLYDTTFLRNTWPAMWRKRRWLYGMLASMWVPLGWMTTRVMTDSGSAGLGESDLLLPPATYAMTQFGVILGYLKLSVLPTGLVFDHAVPPAVMPGAGKGEWTKQFTAHVLPQAVAVLGLFGASVFGVLFRKWWGFAGCVVFLVLGPTSSVLPIADLMVEHRMYLPTAAVVALLVFVVDAVLRVDALAASRLRLGVALAAVVGVAFLVLTVQRNAEYGDEVRLWTTVTEREPHNPRAWRVIGKAHFDAAQSGAASGAEGAAVQALFGRAYEAYARAGELEPGYALPHAEAGRTLLASLRAPGAPPTEWGSRLERAVAMLDAAVAADPAAFTYRRDAGVARFQLARVLDVMGDPARAGRLLVEAEALLEGAVADAVEGDTSAADDLAMVRRYVAERAGG